MAGAAVVRNWRMVALCELCRRTFEPLRKLALHGIAESAAQCHVGRLRAVPADYATSGHGCKSIRHGVNGEPYRAIPSKKYAESQRPRRVARWRAWSDRRKMDFIAAASLQDLEALCFESAAHLKGQIQEQIAFANALRAASAGSVPPWAGSSTTMLSPVRWGGGGGIVG